jgi:hypothetical protein
LEGTHPSNVSDIYEEMSEKEQEENHTNDDDENNSNPFYDDPLELLAYKAGTPAGGIFVIIKLAGASQHKVAVDDVIIVNKLLPLSK